MTARSVNLARRGLMFVLSSPSGAGKSTIARQLLKEDQEIELSISVTTRERRPSELDGVHYHFIDKETFSKLSERGDLLESAEVHGNFYGTPREPVEKALSSGRDVLFDIDWQGTRQIADRLPDDVVRVFILPPSMDELQARLKRRAEDDENTIQRRLVGAREEIEKWADYDYVIVNEDLQEAFAKVRAILIAERIRRARTIGLRPFISGLLDEAQSITASATRNRK